MTDEHEESLPDDAAESIDFPIDGILDLHTFDPKDVKDLVPEYILACQEKGISELRIVHGKGTGIMRETVHAILKKTPDVEAFRTAGEDEGGWGATVVTLKHNE